MKSRSSRAAGSHLRRQTIAQPPGRAPVDLENANIGIGQADMEGSGSKAAPSPRLTNRWSAETQGDLHENLKPIEETGDPESFFDFQTPEVSGSGRIKGYARYPQGRCGAGSPADGTPGTTRTAERMHRCSTSTTRPLEANQPRPAAGPPDRHCRRRSRR